MRVRSKSASSLLEIIIIILVFALCCIGGLKAVIAADKELDYSEKLTAGCSLSDNIAEQFKSGAELSEIASFDENGYAVKYYDMADRGTLNISLLFTSNDGEPQKLTITVSDEKYQYSEITVSRIGGAS